MRAVILAAGVGGRLNGTIGGQPKCLARVGSDTLLDRQLRTLRSCGITETTVVVGHRAAMVVRACEGAGVDFVHNPTYAATNSLYSLWLARHQIDDGFVVLNGDVLFHPQLLVDLLTARYEDALLVAAREEACEYSDEEMKVRVRAGRVTDIAKTLPQDCADGENVGIAKFSRDGAAILLEEADHLVSGGALQAAVPAAFARFCRRRALHAVGTRGLPWIEIDFPEDYSRACTDVLPALHAMSTPPTAPAGAASHV